MPFDKVTGRAARSRLQGLHRARFWRSVGFANLVRARERKHQLAVERNERRRLEEFSQFAHREITFTDLES